MAVGAIVVLGAIADRALPIQVRTQIAEETKFETLYIREFDAPPFGKQATPSQPPSPNGRRRSHGKT